MKFYGFYNLTIDADSESDEYQIVNLEHFLQNAKFEMAAKMY